MSQSDWLSHKKRTFEHTKYGKEKACEDTENDDLLQVKEKTSAETSSATTFILDFSLQHCKENGTALQMEWLVWM
jgi:hypothetical protein